MKIQRICILFLLALFLPLFSFSQSYIGVEGGLVKSWLDYHASQNSDSPTMIHAYQFGAVFQHEKDWKVLKLGFYYNPKGDQDYEFNAFEVPVLLGVQPFKGKVGATFYGGTYLAWWHQVLGGSGVLEKSHPLNNNWDVGLKAGMEVFFRFGKGAKISLGLFTTKGLRSLHYLGSDSQVNLQFKQVSWTLGYFRSF